LLALVVVRAQEPPPGGRGAGGRGAPGGQTPAVPQISARPPVDPAAHDRGRALWATQCVGCHGTQARGSETGPNIIRTKTVNYDRSSFTPGSVLGPFLKAGHPTQSGKPSASFTDEEIVGLAHFLRSGSNTMRGSASSRPVTSSLATRRRAKRTQRRRRLRHVTTPPHATSSAFARASPRPSICAAGALSRRWWRGGAEVEADRQPPQPEAATVVASRRLRARGVRRAVEQSGFYVTPVRRTAPSASSPRPAPRWSRPTLQAHIDLLDRISDKQIHGVVAYLRT
jgi:mono/diheme cytochrome c family protein